MTTTTRHAGALAQQRLKLLPLQAAAGTLTRDANGNVIGCTDLCVWQEPSAVTRIF